MAAANMNQPVRTPTPTSATAAGSTNIEGVIFASASRTNATYTSDELNNPGAKGVRLYADVTAVGAGPGTIIVTVEVRDPVTNNWVQITGATSPANPNEWKSVQTRTLTIYPGITAAAGAAATNNTEVSSFVGVSWRVKVVVGVNAVTFSIGGEYLL